MAADPTVFGDLDLRTGEEVAACGETRFRIRLAGPKKAHSDWLVGDHANSVPGILVVTNHRLVLRSEYVIEERLKVHRLLPALPGPAQKRSVVAELSLAEYVECGAAGWGGTVLRFASHGAIARRAPRYTTVEVHLEDRGSDARRSLHLRLSNGTRTAHPQECGVISVSERRQARIRCPDCGKPHRLPWSPPPAFPCGGCGRTLDLRAFSPRVPLDHTDEWSRLQLLLERYGTLRSAHEKQQATPGKPTRDERASFHAERAPLCQEMVAIVDALKARDYEIALVQGANDSVSVWVNSAGVPVTYDDR